ncbi:MAG: fused MFS/spermidine synthase [Sphingomonadaceae bacterium]|uniref:spermidine synthase n=1 Tax=Thermaurantiacus sp. TaxID=2820283 RepID=UPI00298EF2F8|nr:fused MFS/spermidine synthase [Thermaurantiacus sp.]MCS6987217.1 fused MFS/spermidine synthase [Sphingomonadaceae bacterium]MDW8414437.1 fused MFS/spermidine synthase [Thermaurantiacus sp.]
MTAPSAAGAAATLSRRALFIAIVALGSFLLFLVQPMVARIALPRLGGAPAVWNTAMAFYQAALLLGYLWAHGLSRLAPRAQAAAHLALLLAAAATLPVGLAEGAPPPGQEAGWLVRALALGIGPLFVAVAAQAPLMQAWFARTDDPNAREPWFLYAASNAGSLFGLLAYPLVLEPLLTLSAQRWLWSAGYGLLVLLVATAALGLPAGPTTTAPSAAAPAPSLGRQIRWVAWAAVPSGLMLSTTAHLTTDIMAMPLLWVIPLALYLLSLVLAFGTHAARWTRIATTAAPVLLMIFGAAGMMAIDRAASLYGVASLLLLFTLAVALHGALAADRPNVTHLTRFYLLLALGGGLGGAFAALVAPVVFDWVWEHPLLLLAAGLLLPARPLTRRIGALWVGPGGRARALRVLHAPVALVLSWWLGAAFTPAEPTPATVAGLMALAGLGLLAIGRPFAFTVQLALLVMAAGGWRQLDISTIPDARTRSFFGIHAIQNDLRARVRRLVHGTTMHGLQSLDPAKARIPLSYYGPESGAGLVLGAAERLFGPRARIGVVGLGTGSLVCHARPGQDWTVFEIDPAVVHLVIERQAFTYVRDCQPGLRLVLGDARLRLAREPAGRFDVLAVDAFTSDSIPLHLLTREAMRTYWRTLSPQGVLLLHVSNRFLDLEPVVAAIVRAEGLVARRLRHVPRAETLAPGLVWSASDWIAVTRTEAAMARLMAEARSPGGAPAAWAPLSDPGGRRAWSDEHAAVVEALKPLSTLLP